MKRPAHFIMNGLLMAIYLITTNYINFDVWSVPKCIFFLIFMSIAPDYDKSFDLPHRHWLFHSLFFPFLFWICFWKVPDAGFGLLVVGFHLVCDIPQEEGKKPTGTYLIHITDSWVLTAKQTKTWLGLSGLLGIVGAFILDFLPLVV